MAIIENGISARALGSRWWVLVVRGLAAVLFGLFAFFSPARSLMALVFVWGAYAVVDGIFNLALAARGGTEGRSWGWLLFEGLVSLAAGVVTFIYPGLTAVVLLFIIAAWAFATGIAEIVAAIDLRARIKGEWMLAAAGVLSILFSLVLLFRPVAGALAIVWTIGAYAIIFGALMIGLGLRVHSWYRRTERRVPPGGLPTPA